MKTFYLTTGRLSKNKRFWNWIIIIKAENYDAARNKAFEILGSTWCFLHSNYTISPYSEEKYISLENFLKLKKEETT